MRKQLGFLTGAILMCSTFSLKSTSSTTSPAPSLSLPPTITNIDVLSSFVIRLVWEPVITTPPTFAYIVEYKPSLGKEWRRLQLTHLCTHTLNNLLPQTFYDIRVLAISSVGEVPSSTYSIKTHARVPTTPEITDILPLSQTEVLIKWKHPTTPPGVIWLYTISYSPTHQQGKPCVKIVAGNVTMETISGLDPAVRYDFNISAISNKDTRALLLPLLRQERQGSVPSVPVPSNHTDSTIPVAVGGSVGVVAVLLLLVLIVALTCKFCICRKKQSVNFVRTSSVRLSTMKKKAVDPTEEFRVQHKNDALENHSPLAVAEFIDRLNVMKMNDNQLFLEEFGAIPMTIDHPCEASNMPENKLKNRFNNILAYDYNRVRLQDGLNTDYINANYCDGYLGKNIYVATQGPLPETVPDFWQMVWETDAHTIVMLTNVQERGKPKCAIYWPSKTGATETYGNIEVTLTNVTQLADYTTRAFVINKIGFGRIEPHDVCQFHFTSWPDHGVPQYATAMLAMCRRVRTYHPNVGPIVVHCSAGVGRTGTYLAIDTMVERLKHNEAMLDIFGYIYLLRYQRNFMVQTEDQYFFIHEAVAEAILCGQTEVTVHELSSYMEELHKPNDTTRIDVEFRRLLIDKTDPYRFTSALKDVNKLKNRFVNVLPYDANRVYLEYIRATEGSDYINASYVDSYRRQKAFIATQGPLMRTVVDFWRMIRQYKCPVIVMLTELVEKGQERSALYWPRELREPKTFGNMTVEVTNQRPSPAYTHRELTLINTETGERREVHQFQYHGWPEQGVPLSGHDFIHFIQEVRNFYSALEVTHPMVVHCSNGVGRTGVFIAMHIILERMLVEGRVDVFQTIKSLRIQRPAMVQTVEQYAFCYDVALDFVESSGLLQQPLPTEQRLRGNSSAGELRRKNPSRNSISVPKGETYTRRSSVRLAPSTSQLQASAAKEDQYNIPVPLSEPTSGEVGASSVPNKPSSLEPSRLSSVPEVVVINEDGSRQDSIPDIGTNPLPDTMRLISPPTTTLQLDFNPNSSEA